MTFTIYLIYPSGVYDTVPILEYTPNLMKVIQNETIVSVSPQA